MLNSLKSLKRIRFKAFLIILQLSLGLSMVNTCLVMYSNNKSQLDNFNKLLNPEKTYLTRLMTYNTSTNSNEWVSESQSKLRQEEANVVMNKLNELKKDTVINSLNLYRTYPPFNGFLKYVPSEYQDTLLCSEITVNESFYNHFNLPIIEGRGFTSDDFSLELKDNIPIIIGTGYKDKLKIGDTINRATPTDKITYEVVGYYDDFSIPAIPPNDDFLAELLYSNYFFIIPTNAHHPIYTYNAVLINTGIFVEVDSLSQIEYVEKEVNKLVKGSNFYMKVQPINNEYTNAKEMLISEVISSILLGISLVIISIIGIVTCIIGEINRRRNEYGIRISCGATIKSITKEMFFEILLMVLISLIITFIISVVKSAIYDFNLEYKVMIIYNLIFSVFISLIISIIPISKIRKLNVTELMRGQ